jgi:putative NADPH-quinone reductase
MRILVVHAHPVAESYSAALFRCVVGSLEERGHVVRPLDLYACGFDPVLSREARLAYEDPALNAENLGEHLDHLQWPEGLIFVYPTWWYSLPAMLKGWLDRVWLPEVAFRLAPDGGRIHPMMTHIRLLGGVSTYGSPWWWTRWVGDPGRRVLMRGLRPLCAPQCKTFWLAHYNIDRSTPATRSAFLERVRRKMLAIPVQPGTSTPVGR